MQLIDRLALRTGAGEGETALLGEVLAEAIETFLDVRYPVAKDKPSYRDYEVEPEYEGLILLMAVDIWSKIGAEGERSHSENGVSRTYSGDWVSKDLLARIVPYCGVVS